MSDAIMAIGSRADYSALTVIPAMLMPDACISAQDNNAIRRRSRPLHWRFDITPFSYAHAYARVSWH